MFIQKKKLQKKTNQDEQHSKGMMNSFVKGMTGIMRGKK